MLYDSLGVVKVVDLREDCSFLFAKPSISSKVCSLCFILT